MSTNTENNKDFEEETDSTKSNDFFDKKNMRKWIKILIFFATIYILWEYSGNNYKFKKNAKENLAPIQKFFGDVKTNIKNRFT